MRFTHAAVRGRLFILVAGLVVSGPSIALSDGAVEAAAGMAEAVPDVHVVAYPDDRGFDRRRSAGNAAMPRAGWVYGWHWRGATPADRPAWQWQQQGAGWRAASPRFVAPYGYQWTDRRPRTAWRGSGRWRDDQQFPSARAAPYAERRLLAEDDLIRRQPWRSAPSDSMPARRWRERQVSGAWRE